MTLPSGRDTGDSFLSWWAVDGGEGKKSGSEYRNAFTERPRWAVILTSTPSQLKWQSGTREEKVENKEENFEDPGTSHSA